MAVRKLIVRHFIACETVERSPDGLRHTLHNLVHTLPAPASFPLVISQIYLFALLTDGKGQVPFTVELVTWDDEGEEQSIWTSPPVTIDLGNDPLRVQGKWFRLRRVRFDHPGIYEFRLCCE